MPEISVIIPVYNVAAYLEEALDSLLRQSFTNFEVIAVDDGSTDDSLKILNSYAEKDSRITVISQRNQGQSVARNVAIDKATGKYLYMMDSDDTIQEDTLQQCYDYAEKTKADFVFFDGNIMYEEGAGKLNWNYKRTHLCQENTAYNGEQLLRMMLDKRKHSCVVWLLLIRRSYLEGINLRFYPGIIQEDELFTTILTLSSNNIFCLQRSLVNHRVRRSSTMGKRYSRRNIDCYLTVIDQLLKFQDSPITRYFARYTLSKVFYTGHILPLKEKVPIFLRALKSGYLKFIGRKIILVFWFKR